MWNVAHPDRIASLHRRFIDAGADIILTNSFGGNRYRLALHKAEARVAELNEAAARIARRVADESGRDVVVAGSMGPTGEIMAPIGPLDFEAASDAFAEQAAALARGGADVLWIETMSARDEAEAAIAGAETTGLPVVCTLSFDTNGRTMMGMAPADLAALQRELAPGPMACGANCGVGASEVVVAILNLAAAALPDAVLVAKANCGIPQYVDGAIRYDGTPELMARLCVPRARCRGADHRRLLRHDARAHSRDARGARSAPARPAARLSTPWSRHWAKFPMARARRRGAISTASPAPRREPARPGAAAGGPVDVNEPDTTHAFDGKAEAYARHRLDYSPVAVEAITAIAGLGMASVIADLGAGTGMLTRHFVERVGCAFAIEPNNDMRALALASLGQHASVRMMEGTAQETGLPDHSVDAVLAGRAIQWFDPAPAQAEMRRILRPGGWLVVVRTPVTDAYSSAALERLRDERISRHDRNARHHWPQADVDDYFGGGNYIRLSYPCAAQETWPEFLGRLHSLSFSPQPGDAKYAGFERAAREIFDGGAVGGLLRVQYATEVLMKQIVPPVAAPRSLVFAEAEIEGDIVTRFERVAASVPNGIALKANGEAWTYAQLDGLANRIAEIVLRESAGPRETRGAAVRSRHRRRRQHHGRAQGRSRVLRAQPHPPGRAASGNARRPGIDTPALRRIPARDSAQPRA